MPESQLIINMLSNLFNGQAAAIVRITRDHSIAGFGQPAGENMRQGQVE